MRETKFPSIECIIKGLKMCLYHNNSIFAGVNLLQTNAKAKRANLCSYSDIAVGSIDSAIMDQKATCFDDLVYFGKVSRWLFFTLERNNGEIGIVSLFLE